MNRYTLNDGQDGLTPVCSQLLGTLLVGMEPVGLATGILFFEDIGLILFLEVAIGIVVADVYLSGLATCYHFSKAVVIAVEEFQALLGSDGTSLCLVVGVKPDRLVEHHVGIGPQHEQRVDDGAEVVDVVVRGSMTVVLALYRVVGTQHDTEHQWKIRMCLYQLLCTTDDIAEECLVASGNDIVGIGQKVTAITRIEREVPSHHDSDVAHHR